MQPEIKQQNDATNCYALYRNPLQAPQSYLKKIRKLSLKENSIVTVQEIFCRLSMPLLSTLDIRDNFIRDISSIRKLESQYLQNFNFSGNCISGFETTSEIYAQKLVCLGADCYTSYAWITKLETPCLLHYELKKKPNAFIQTNYLSKNKTIRKGKEHVFIKHWKIQQILSHRFQTISQYLATRKGKINLQNKIKTKVPLNEEQMIKQDHQEKRMQTNEKNQQI